MNKNTNKLKQIAIILLFIIIIVICAIFNKGEENQTGNNIIENNKISYEISNIPEYSGKACVEINNNIPEFTTENMNIKEDYYSSLENGRVRNGYDKN